MIMRGQPKPHRDFIFIFSFYSFGLLKNYWKTSKNYNFLHVVFQNSQLNSFMWL